MKVSLTLCFLAITSLLIIPYSYDNSFGETLSPLKQWKKFADPQLLTCKDGFVLLQKSNGFPACVSPLTYLKLIDRGFTKFDFTLILNRSDMMTSLMETMASNQILMDHWHDMMLKNPHVIDKTMSNWISQIKDNPSLLENIMGPITTDLNLRAKMIEELKKHPIMENSLKENPSWMKSVHEPQMNPGMDNTTHYNECLWCPDYDSHDSIDRSMHFSNSDKMMDLMHHVWINEKLNKDMHEFMLENPAHMAMMSDKMMSQIMTPIMNDPELREQMISLMLKNQGFMNSIRH